MIVGQEICGGWFDARYRETIQSAVYVGRAILVQILAQAAEPMACVRPARLCLSPVLKVTLMRFKGLSYRLSVTGRLLIKLHDAVSFLVDVLRL